MSRVGSALLSLALAAVITLASYTEVVFVAAAVLVVQVLVASAPSPAGATGRSIRVPRFAAAIAAGLVATILTVFPHLLGGADGTSSHTLGQVETGMLSGLLPAVAVAVFVALISQMLRTDGRADLVPSTSFAVALGVFAALPAGWIGAAQSLGAPEVVAIGAAGLGAGVVAWAVPLDRWVCGSAAVVLGGAAGAAVAVGIDSLVTWVLGVAIGSGAALFAVLGEVLGRAWSQGRTHASAGWGFPGALSVALAAPIVYVGGQLVGAAGL